MENNNNTGNAIKTDGFTEYKMHILESKLSFRTTNHIMATLNNLAKNIFKMRESLDYEVNCSVQLMIEVQYLRSEVEFWRTLAIENLKKQQIQLHSETPLREKLGGEKK